MKLIRFELNKICGIRWLLILFVLVTLLGCGYTFILENQNIDNWKSYALEHKESLEEMRELTDEGDDFYDEANVVFENEIKKIDFCVENNIIYGCQTVWTYMYEVKSLFGIITLMMIVLSSNIISVEKTSNMLEKIISKRYTKNNLLITKIMSLNVLQILSFIGIFIILLLIGIISFGNFTYYDSVEMVDGIITKNNVITNSFVYIVAAFLSTLIYSACSMLLEMLFEEKKIVTIIVVLSFLFNDMLVSISEKIHMEHILPFHYLDTNSYMTIFNTTQIIIGYVYMIVLYIILIICAMFIYKKKEIV